MYFGSAIDNLAAVLQSSFDKNKHDCVCVQSSGCGKTCTVMQLALDHDYIVLPLELSSRFNKLFKPLVVAENGLKDDLGEQPNAEQIQTFSDRSLRLVHLVFFSLLALFKHCVATKLVDAWNAAHRHQLAVLYYCVGMNSFERGWCRTSMSTSKRFWT
jgi:hypothetical protein